MTKARTKEAMMGLMIKLNKANNMNNELKNIAVTLFENAVKIGNKIFLTIPVSSLKIDHAMYQRPIQRHVHTIAKNWNDDKCDPLLVNYRGDGYFYIIDGQHRYEAAMIREIKNLVCTVLVGLTVKDEADLFVGQNDGSKKLSPFDTYKANLCRGDARDLLIDKVCKEYGVRVERSSKNKTLKSVTAARRIVSDTRALNYDNGDLDAEPLRWIFDILKNAKWEYFKEAYGSDYCYALYNIYKKYYNVKDYAKTKLIHTMEMTTPAAMLATANVKFAAYKCGSAKLTRLFETILENETDNENDVSHIIDLGVA